MNPSHRKYLDISFGAVAVAVWFLLRQALVFLWVLFRLPSTDSWVVSLPDLIAAAVGLVFFVLLRSKPKVKGFVSEVILELSKVTWPTRQETVVSTGVIIVMVGIASLFIFFFDTVLGTFARKILE